MLCLNGFEIYSRWVPLKIGLWLVNNVTLKIFHLIRINSFISKKKKHDSRACIFRTLDNSKSDSKINRDLILRDNQVQEPIGSCQVS